MEKIKLLDYYKIFLIVLHFFWWLFLKWRGKEQCKPWIPALVFSLSDRSWFSSLDTFSLSLYWYFLFWLVSEGWVSLCFFAPLCPCILCISPQSSLVPSAICTLIQLTIISLALTFSLNSIFISSCLCGISI